MPQTDDATIYHYLRWIGSHLRILGWIFIGYDKEDI